MSVYAFGRPLDEGGGAWITLRISRWQDVSRRSSRAVTVDRNRVCSERFAVLATLCTFYSQSLIQVDWCSCAKVVVYGY